MSTLFRLFIACITLSASLAFAADPLVITRGTDRAIPVAVVPFGVSGGGLPDDPARIIAADL